MTMFFSAICSVRTNLSLDFLPSQRLLLDVIGAGLGRMGLVYMYLPVKPYGRIVRGGVWSMHTDTYPFVGTGISRL